MARSRISVQLDEWVDLTRSLLAQAWLPHWPLRVLPYLSGTFDSPAAYNWVEPDRPNPLRADVFGAPDGWPRPQDEPEWNALMLEHHPLLRWYATTGTDASMATARVPSAIATSRNLAVYRELLAGLDQQISIPLYVRGMDHKAFVMGRGPAFSPEEIQLALLIQPLLRLLHRQGEVLARAPHPVAAQADLSGRELAVLHLLGQGLSARMIGVRLGISERTAHKHLQNAYRKLSAHDRVTALSAAAAAGLLGVCNDQLTGAPGSSLLPSPRYQDRGLLRVPANA